MHILKVGYSIIFLSIVNFLLHKSGSPELLFKEVPWPALIWQKKSFQMKGYQRTHQIYRSANLIYHFIIRKPSIWAGNSRIAISSILVALLASSGNPSINKLDTCMELPKKRQRKISTNLGSQPPMISFIMFTTIYTPVIVVMSQWVQTIFEFFQKICCF